MLQFGGTAAAVALRGTSRTGDIRGVQDSFSLGVLPRWRWESTKGFKYLLEHPTCQPVCSLKLHLID